MDRARVTPAPLDPRPRALRLALAFLLLALASPGSVTQSGSAVLAFAAFALWAATASRPGRGAGLLEVVFGGLAWAWITSWAAYVWWGTMLVMGPGMGLYMLFAGASLRRLARFLPLALAAPLAWMLSEGVRAVLPPPFGYQWMRQGTHLHDAIWIAGSARVWGIEGLSYVLIAAAGLAADLLERRRPTALAWVSGLAPGILGVALAALVHAPALVAGPRLLLVQPAIPQARKMQGRNPVQLFDELTELTRSGLKAIESAGHPPPDLVCWSETMYPHFIAAPGLMADVERGVRFPEWMSVEWGPDQFRTVGAIQRAWVDELLLGAKNGRGVLPQGTAFLTGAEYLAAVDGVVRRQNAVLLWPAAGEVRGPVSKLVLVPGAETMLGLERIGAVRSAIRQVAGYLPDLYTDPSAARTLELTGRSGRTWRFSAAVCFDNAFDAPFTQPLRAGSVDFHLVASNEAWFRSSLELDQMIAFSRLEAIATGRAVVRCTNSGVTALLLPDGREAARLVVQGRDREVPGTLEVEVPVPESAEAAAARTPFVRWEHGWSALWIVAPALLIAWERLRRRRTPVPVTQPVHGVGPGPRSGSRSGALRGPTEP
jgi:apolipoprotein N-acyltransferase